MKYINTYQKWASKLLDSLSYQNVYTHITYEFLSPYVLQQPTIYIFFKLLHNNMSIQEIQPKLCVTTLFCTAHLGCTVDLNLISRTRWNVEYYNGRSIVTLRIRNPMSTAQIYRSGKMIVSGMRSESEARKVVRKFARIIQKTDPNCQIKLRNFKVRSIAGDFHFNFKSSIELSDLCKQVGVNAVYEPELTPNHFTYYPLQERRIAVSVYTTGYVKLSGGQSLEEMDQVFQSVQKLLIRYKRAAVLHKLMKHRTQMQSLSKRPNSSSQPIQVAKSVDKCSM